MVAETQLLTDEVEAREGLEQGDDVRAVDSQFHGVP